MPQITGSLLSGKPIVSVALASAIPIPGAVAPETLIPQFNLREYRALLDTGADITCLCNNVVRECNLPPFGIINMASGKGENLHTSHLIHLGVWCEQADEFDGEKEIRRTLYQLPNEFIAAAITENSWFDVIIGTDILSNHEFTLFKGGQFKLTLS